MVYAARTAGLQHHDASGNARAVQVPRWRGMDRPSPRNASRMKELSLDPKSFLPEDGYAGTLVSRAWVPGAIAGPSVIAIREDGFVLRGGSSMAQISRDPLDLVAHAIGPNHQYPDGLVLFLGTMFAPVEDRGQPGGGFTHKVG